MTTTNRTAYVEVRSQKSVGTWPAQGPDTYVMVQVVPEGSERLKRLDRAAAERRGIKLIYCGEGYQQRRTTTRSALGAAIYKAERMAAKINRREKVDS